MDFMDGVTIIKECTDNSTICAIMIIPSMIAAALGIGIIQIAEKLARNKIIAIIANVSGVAFTHICLITTFAITQMDKFQEPNREYEVVLDGDVDMNEFYKRYEIIDFEDSKYKIKFKEE